MQGIIGMATVLVQSEHSLAAVDMKWGFPGYDGKNRFVILTTQANASMAPVHERMPLILEKSEMESWLSDDGCAETLLKKEPAALARSTEYEQMSLF